MLAFYMSANPSEPSELSFGSYNKNKFTGDLIWHDVVHQFYWSIKLDDIEIGGKRLNLCKDKEGGCMITPDSGTSLMTMPNWALKAASQHLPKNDHCHSADDFKDMAFIIGGHRYPLPAKHWVREHNPTS